MKKTILSLISFLLLCTSLSSQQVICGYDLVVDQMEKQYPGYRKSINKTFENAKQQHTLTSHSNMTYTIPVVVHVVWNEEVEKLNDSLITSQIEILNEDFQRLNEDADNVRDIFADVVGNPMINFTLEEVIYVETDTLFEIDLFANELADNVKVSSIGGSDPRDVNRFLNIWICKIQPITFAGQNLGQLLGYAYPPNDLDNWPAELMVPNPNFDGVVLDYRVVGKNNPNMVDPGLGEEIQFKKGRSAVHEVGHYLGLRHIWGDGQFGALDSCDEDDGIEDTPNAGASSEFTCNALQNTCSASADDLPDMIENFMDYSTEECVNSFTIGQIALMRGVLESQRCQLVQLNCDVSTTHLAKINISIFPNPSDGIFYIESAVDDLSIFDIHIYNATGTLQNVSISGKSIDLSSYPSGLYFVEGKNKTHIFQQKLMKH